jgi:hypothetical protein
MLESPFNMKHKKEEEKLKHKNTEQIQEGMINKLFIQFLYDTAIDLILRVFCAQIQFLIMDVTGSFFVAILLMIVI